MVWFNGCGSAVQTPIHSRTIYVKPNRFVGGFAAVVERVII
jgi:hypothetical protein